VLNNVDRLNSTDALDRRQMEAFHYVVFAALRLPLSD
jgi:hypothetical protein